ncbi:hypothetical protein EON62_03225, partial [archaeon]
QERRTYIPQGWTKAYEFSTADMRAGAHVIDQQLARTGGERVPWAYVHGLIENTVYGGRVDNSSDLRVLRAYLISIFHVDMLSGRAGMQLPSGLPFPQSNDYAEHMSIIERLPETDTPKLFNLPANIERSLQRVVSQGVIDSVKTIRVATGAASTFDREAWRTRLAPVLEQWQALLSAAPALTARPPPVAAREAALLNPIASFFVVEAALATRLLDTVDADLQAIKRVVLGTELLSASVLAAATPLLAGAVPDTWSSLWSGPDSPLPWLQGMTARALASRRWAAAAEAGWAHGTSIQLHDLYRPSIFLNALRQHTARAIQAASTSADAPAMDALKLVTAWDAAALSRAPVVASITGLAVQGALFDTSRNMLTDATMEANELQPLPPVFIAWVPSTFPDVQPAATSLAVPVYQALDRSQYVFDMSVPCGTDRVRWVLAGVAIFIQSA